MIWSENRYPLFGSMRYLPIIMARKLFGLAHELRGDDRVIQKYLDHLTDPSWDGVFSLESK